MPRWRPGGQTVKISDQGPPKFLAMAGRAANDIWVAGQWRTLLRWDGTKWSDGASPTGYHLNVLWVGSAGDVWLGGDNGTIRRRH